MPNQQRVSTHYSVRQSSWVHETVPEPVEDKRRDRNAADGGPGWRGRDVIRANRGPERGSSDHAAPKGNVGWQVPQRPGGYIQVPCPKLAAKIARKAAGSGRSAAGACGVDYRRVNFAVVEPGAAVGVWRADEGGLIVQRATCRSTSTRL
jgi:hypothetical protein